MSSRIRSARSQGARTPRRLSTRSTKSAGSPARSTGRLSTLVDQFKDDNVDSFVLSPVAQHSVLSDTTQIAEPRRKSWWKKLDDNSREVLIEAMSDNHPGDMMNVVEELDVEILSQEKRNIIVDMPDSSGSESIASIVIPQRKLFTQKDTVPTKKKFGKIIGPRESMAKANKTNIDIQDVGPKKLFGQAPTQKTFFPNVLNTSSNKTKAEETRTVPKKIFGQSSSKKSMFPTEVVNVSPRSSAEHNVSKKKLFQHDVRAKTVFPAALLALSPNKTTNKTLGGEVKGQVRSLFGNKGSTKRKNMFADFIDSESEDELPEIQPKVFGFQKKTEMRRQGSSTSIILADDEDDWKMLPSSTMMELDGTPVKKPKLSRITQSDNDKSRPLNQSINNKTKDKTTEVTNARKASSNVTKKNTTKDMQKVADLHREDEPFKQDVTSKLHQNKTLPANLNRSYSKNKKINKTVGDNKKETSVLKENLAESVLKDHDESRERNNYLDDQEENIEKYKVFDTIKESEQIIEGEFNESLKEMEVESILQDEEDEAMELTYEENQDQNENDEVQKENGEGNDQDAEMSEKEEEQEVAVSQQEQEESENEEESRQEEDENEENLEVSQQEEDEEEEASQREEDENEDNVDLSQQEVKNDEAEISEEEEEENVEVLQQEEVQEEQSQQEDNENEESVEISQQEEDEEEEVSQQGEDENEDESQQEEVQETEVSQQEEDENEEEAEASLEQDENEDNVDLSQQEVENDEAEISGEEEDQEVEVSQQEEEENEEAEVDESQENIEENEEEVQEDTEDEEMEQDVEESEQETHQSLEQDEEIEESQENVENEEPNEQSENEIQESPNVTHDTTGRNRKIKSPEAILQNNANRKDSSAEGSGWDSHRVTKQTIRQTFGKGYTPKKSLRALVMEKSAQRQTLGNEVTFAESMKIPQANSTEIGQVSMHFDDNDPVSEESDLEVSRKTRQATLEMYLEKLKNDNMERKKKVEALVRSSLEAPKRNLLEVYNINPKFGISKPKPRIQTKPKKVKPSAVPLGEIPEELLADLKSKPPKRFSGKNASWITMRLYRFLEAKLEPRYDYKARVKAEQLVEKIFSFTKLVRRFDVAPRDAARDLAEELARKGIVTTHADFYDFFHEFIPREIRVKVIPDIRNKLRLPSGGQLAPILRDGADRR